MSKKKSDGPIERRYEIGKIVGAHGIGGDLTLLPQTDFPERFEGMETLDLTLPGKPMRSYKVRRIKPYEGKKTFFVSLEGITDRDAAEALRGASVTVAEDERVELEEGEYWLDEIIGLEVFDKAGAKLGEITEVLFTGANDVYIVKTPEGALKALPAVDEVIKSVDVAKGSMTVNIPEGLWE